LPRFADDQLGPMDHFGIKQSLFIGYCIIGCLARKRSSGPPRMPLPLAEYQGSIYENQRASGRRYFAIPEEPARVAAE
jgi:hypothetical protein